ncbi:MAG TPA: hypothetical protein VHE35_26235 [Kofleriaceae bacterium]|nr:hypothetical protein [Kofleriaceae bacterium]
MPVSALLCAVIALVACALPGSAMFVAMGTGLAGLGLGWIGFRRRRAPGPTRLLSVTAVALALLALVLAAGRYAVTLLALHRLVGALT